MAIFREEASRTGVVADALNGMFKLHDEQVDIMYLHDIITSVMTQIKGTVAQSEEPSPHS